MTNPSETAGRPKRAPKPTPLGLMILALLSERPMHPYEMQRLMVARGDDHVVRVQRGSLYPAVERLAAAGLVEHEITEKSGRRPERTVYRITERGSEVAAEWITGMLSTYRNEYPVLGAALSFGALLDPSSFVIALTARRSQLAGMVAENESKAQALHGELPRLFILELEYMDAMIRAELAFVDGLIADIMQGRLTWSREMIGAWFAEVVASGHFSAATGVLPPDETDGQPVDTMPG